jgi:hypothetical protein
MAEDILVILTGILAVAIGNHRVHAELCVLVLIDQMRPHGRSHDIGHIGMALGEVSSEVHLLPSVLLLDLLHPREAEVLPHALALHEVDQPV